MKATLLDLSARVDGYSNVTTDHGQDCEDWVLNTASLWIHPHRQNTNQSFSLTSQAALC